MTDQRPIIWLCGFPSSGNLKAQMGIASLVFGEIKSITELDSKFPVMSIGPQVPSSPAGLPVRFVFSHHVANRYMLAQVKTYKVIYVVRDPVDVGISSAGYLLPRYADMSKMADEELEVVRARLIDEYLKIGSFPEYISYDYGTWASHVTSWLSLVEQAKIDMMLIKFDEMRHKGPEVLAEVAKFIGLTTTPERIAAAVSSWSIDSSRTLEENAIQNKERSRFYKPEWSNAYARGWRYHGRGLSGYGKERLSAEQWEAARYLFGAAAERIGLPLATR